MKISNQFEMLLAIHTNKEGFMKSAKLFLALSCFLGLSAATVGALGALGAAPAEESGHGPDQHRSGPRPARASSRHGRRAYNSEYAGEYLNQVAFPLGGIGAGMICLEGTGALSHVSLRNHPDVFNEPCVFAAIAIKGKRSAARVLEGPVPERKLFGTPNAGNGAGSSAACWNPAHGERSSGESVSPARARRRTRARETAMAFFSPWTRRHKSAASAAAVAPSYIEALATSRPVRRET